MNPTASSCFFHQKKLKKSLNDLFSPILLLIQSSIIIYYISPSNIVLTVLANRNWFNSVIDSRSNQQQNNISNQVYLEPWIKVMKSFLFDLSCHSSNAFFDLKRVKLCLSTLALKVNTSSRAKVGKMKKILLKSDLMNAFTSVFMASTYAYDTYRYDSSHTLAPAPNRHSHWIPFLIDFMLLEIVFLLFVWSVYPEFYENLFTNIDL
jgi:hypothetical protein